MPPKLSQNLPEGIQPKMFHDFLCAGISVRPNTDNGMLILEVQATFKKIVFYKCWLKEAKIVATFYVLTLTLAPLALTLTLVVFHIRVKWLRFI